MRLDGFELRDGYILAFGEWELDLHNDYDVVEVSNQPSSSSARIIFRRNPGDWVNATQPESITMQFERVARFLKKAGDPARATDGDTLQFIGFLHPDHDVMDGYLEDLSDPSQDLILGLEDHSAVKVSAECVSLSVNT